MSHGGREGALLWQPAAPKVGTRCHGNVVPKEERGGRVSWQRLPGLGMLGGHGWGQRWGHGPSTASPALHTQGHTGTLGPAPWGPPALLPEGPLSPQPHPAPSNWPWGGERSHSSPQWPLGPHHMFRNLRDTGAQAGMRRRDTVPELSTVAEDPKPGLRLAEPGDFRGVEPGPCA